MAIDEFCAGCVTAPRSVGPCSSCTWNESQVPVSTTHLRRHSRLHGRYYIGHVLGQGGFGITYLARDLVLERAVAIKEYLPMNLCARLQDGSTVYTYGDPEKDASYKKGLKGFLAEALTLARLHGHAGIVEITDTFEENGTAYMVMPFIDGVTLKRYLADKGGSMPWRKASEVMLPVMDALRTVHEHGLLHRDISPDNVMVARSGQIKLIDFGAARQTTGEQSQSLSAILKHGYAPGEQYSNRSRQGPWTDVYAVGATLFHVVTGVKPTAASDRVDDDDVPRTEFPRDVPDRLKSVLFHAMAQKPAMRYQTIAEFQAALVGVLHPGQAPEGNDGVITDPVPPPPPPRPEKDPPPGNTMPYIVGGVVLALAIIGSAIAFLANYKTTQPPGPASIVNGGGAPTALGNGGVGTGTTGDGSASSQLRTLRPDTPTPATVTPSPSDEVSWQEESDTFWITMNTSLDKNTDGKSASICITNHSSKHVLVALRVQIDNDWLTIGWRTVDAGKTLNTHIHPSGAVFYMYAQSDDRKLIWQKLPNEKGIETMVATNDKFIRENSEEFKVVGESQANTTTVSMFEATVGEPGAHWTFFNLN